MFDKADKCNRCGKNGTWETLYFIGGEWWCRSCMWAEYTFDAAVNYILLNKEEFADAYPDGFEFLWDLLEGKDHDLADDRTEEFISDNLEDYVDWVLSNPTIVPVKELRKRWKETR